MTILFQNKKDCVFTSLKSISNCLLWTRKRRFNIKLVYVSYGQGCDQNQYEKHDMPGICSIISAFSKLKKPQKHRNRDTCYSKAI